MSNHKEAGINYSINSTPQIPGSHANCFLPEFPESMHKESRHRALGEKGDDNTTEEMNSRPVIQIEQSMIITNNISIQI